MAVIGVADGALDRQQFEEGHVGQDRDAEFPEKFGDVIAALIILRRRLVGEPGLDQRVGRAAVAFLAIFGAQRETDRAATGHRQEFLGIACEREARGRLADKRFGDRRRLDEIARIIRARGRTEGVERRARGAALNIGAHIADRLKRGHVHPAADLSARRIDHGIKRGEQVGDDEAVIADELRLGPAIGAVDIITKVGKAGLELALEAADEGQAVAVDLAEAEADVGIKPIEAQGRRTRCEQVLAEIFVQEGVLRNVDHGARPDHRLAAAIARRIVIIDAEIAAHAVAEVIMRAEVEVVAFDIGNDRDRIVEAETGDAAIVENPKQAAVGQAGGGEGAHGSVVVEDETAEAAGVAAETDDAIARKTQSFAAGGDDIVGNAVVGARVRGIDHGDIIFHVGLARRDFLHLRIVGGDRDVASAFAEILAGDQAGAIGQALATARGLRAVERQAKSVEIILEDDVDHARYGVGAVNCRCAAGDDLDAFDQIWVDRIEVDRGAVGGARDAAFAVDEHKRAVRSEAAQIDQRQAAAVFAARARGARLLALLHAPGKADRRLLRERAADVELRIIIVERFGRDDADRCRQVENGTADARPRHDNVIASLYRLLVSRCGSVLGLRGAREAHQTRAKRDRDKRCGNVELAARGRSCRSLDHVFSPP